MSALGVGDSKVGEMRRGSCLIGMNSERFHMPRQD